MITFVTKQTSLESLPDMETCHDIQCVIDYIESKDTFGIDTETTGFWNLRNQILSLQIGDQWNQYVIDWQSINSEERVSILTALSVSPALKILQNAKFDLKFLMQYGCYIQNIFDVMVAECLIEAGRDMPKGSFALDTLAMKYAGMKLDKSIRGIIHREGLTAKVIKYGADDVACLPIIAGGQHLRLTELHMANSDPQDRLTVLGIENRACLALAMIEFNGVKLDLEKWRVLTASIKEQLLLAEKKLDEIVVASPELTGVGSRQMNLFETGIATKINWKSPAQKLELLRKIIPGIEDTSERILSRHKKVHPIVPEMLSYVKLAKLYTGFATKMPTFINPVSGRIHTSFWQNLKTGRVSAENPNMLQIPSRSTLGHQMRNCFVAEEDWLNVGGDLSGAELRIIAEFSQDGVWLDVFKNDGDLHSELCAKTFGIEITQVKNPSHFKPDVAYRDIQKIMSFGLSYGMGPHKLSDTLQVPLEVAEELIQKFFTAVPKVKIFLDKIGKFAAKNGFSRTPLPYGRIRWFDEYKSKNPAKRSGVVRQALNFPIQGANADIIKLALGDMYYEIVQSNLLAKVKLVNVIHDEIQCEAVKSFAEEWKEYMKQTMENAGSVVINSIPMKVDVKIGNSWGETH